VCVKVGSTTYLFQLTAVKTRNAAWRDAFNVLLQHHHPAFWSNASALVIRSVMRNTASMLAVRLKKLTEYSPILQLTLLTVAKLWMIG
jgi:hypothetical protein